mmetsp:Transcript_44876/g.94152  ORF Transcript_44876/g.94152 Transcript_44876/m.94152 type:complete len:89 (-) Transcript_44876:385-651(-)
MTTLREGEAVVEEAVITMRCSGDDAMKKKKKKNVRSLHNRRGNDRSLSFPLPNGCVICSGLNLFQLPPTPWNPQSISDECWNRATSES